MAKKPDILERVNTDLLSYDKQTSDAVSLVTSTIEKLEAVNENIDSKLDEIAQYQNSLELTRNDLENSRVRNSRLIDNFKALINTDSEVKPT